MRIVVISVLLVSLSACQILPSPAPQPVETINEPIPEPIPAPEVPEPEAEITLTLTDTPQNLQAWLDYKQQLLVDPEPERARLQQLVNFDAVAQLQLALLNLHPDMPYVSRFRIQTQLAELVTGFPPRLAALFSWELTFNQKLLEAESAVTAVTRLNAQQQDALDRLQKTNRELQKKIDALTQIEAELNQPAAENNPPPDSTSSLNSVLQQGRWAGVDNGQG